MKTTLYNVYTMEYYTTMKNKLLKYITCTCESQKDSIEKKNKTDMKINSVCGSIYVYFKLDKTILRESKPE